VIDGQRARESSSGNGIHLWNAADAVIEGNRDPGHRDGIYLEHVRGRDAPRQHERGQPALRAALHVLERQRYIGNTFRRNGAGVAVMYSKRVTDQGQHFEDNWGAGAYGLLLKEISDSASRATASGATRWRVVRGQPARAGDGNRFVRNGWAVRVMREQPGEPLHRQRLHRELVRRDDEQPAELQHFEGNYWSRYDGYDLTGDGFGDVPHRPVRLFSLLVERTPAALVLLRSFFVDLLDMAERVARC
jgi:nitrous oxidase accessory protein